MKKKLFLSAGLTICAAIAATGTLAYFTAEDTAHNVITSGYIDIELEEWSEPPSKNNDGIPFENVSGVMPGAEISKIVTVKNIGNADAFIRIKVDLDVALASNVSGTPNLNLVYIDYNTKDWTEKDGYWYYNEVLSTDEITSPLFTTVKFDEGMGNMYQNSIAYVDVSAQAVQCANNGDTVMDANGWPNAE